MKILLAGPVDLEMVREYLLEGTELPTTWAAPITGQLAAAYLQAGHQLHIVTLHFRRDQDLHVHLTGRNLEIDVLPGHREGPGLRDFWKKERHGIRDVMLKSRPDAMHVHWTYEFASAALSTDIPSVITAHDVPSRLWKWMRPRFFWWPRIAMSVVNGRKAEVLTVPSPAAAVAWRRQMKRKGPIELVPNGLLPHIFRRRDLSDVRAKSDPTFASVCNGFTQLKNTLNLIRAFAIVKKTLPGARLVMFGHDHGPDEVAQRIAKQMNAADGIEFRGGVTHQELLDQLSSEADVYVHPSLEESFGMSILEAQALCIPVIAGVDTGGPPWILDEGLAGRLCDVRRKKALAEAMVEVARSPDPQQIEYAYTRARNCFALERVSKRYLELLESAAIKRQIENH